MRRYANSESGARRSPSKSGDGSRATFIAVLLYLAALTGNQYRLRGHTVTLGNRGRRCTEAGGTWYLNVLGLARASATCTSVLDKETGAGGVDRPLATREAATALLAEE